MNIVICEDDKLHRGYIETVVNSVLKSTYPESSITLSTGLAAEVLKYIVDAPLTLYFLGIMLQSDISGLDLAKAIRQTDLSSYIVFITFHDDKISASINYHVTPLGFIHKNDEGFEKAITECINVAFQRSSNSSERTLNISLGRSIKNIEFKDIVYIETVKSKHIIEIFTLNAKYNTHNTLKKVLSDLDGRFVMCSKSYIVNKNMIESFDSKYLTLSSGVVIPYSKIYYNPGGVK